MASKKDLVTALNGSGLYEKGVGVSVSYRGSDEKCNELFERSLQFA
jgi:hypothetical protein